MPAQRPRASFEPISPDFDVKELVETSDNFQYVDRISCETIEEQGIERFEKLVLLHVVIGGKPLVIDGWENRLDPWTFTPKWLRDNHGEKVENARNLTTKESLPLTIGHYLDNMGLLTDQYFERPENYKDKNRQRVYLKDIDCPPVWQEKLKEHLPAGLFYLSESTGEVGGPGAIDEPIPNAAGRRKGKGIATAGDLMSSLPPDMRAENLMCYIGHEGTYTPAHREMCATLGHNVMVEASTVLGENNKPEKPGSSIWFMTESKDRHTVAEYWLSVLGHDIEVEDHFAQVAAWKKAPFKVYIVEQRAGDFILIPPLAPHQVWNRGTRTMKVAWNRTTVETLEMALKEALPNARMVCRDEQYKNKAIIYYTLLKYSALLKSAKMQCAKGGPEADAIQTSKKVRQVQKDFKRLFELYKTIMLSEMFAPELPKEHCEFLPYDSNVTCAYCRGNIFNRFLTCKTCAYALGTETEEPYDVCMDCFAMGRSCGCQSKFKWVEQFKWKELMHRYEEWRNQIIDIDGEITTKIPLPLQEERARLEKKTLAQICQEQLRLRPWVSIKDPRPAKDSEESEEEILVNDDGTVKKSVRKRSKTWLKNHQTCHVCCHRHPRWMMATCTMCERGWCYGTLWRAHDILPTTIMEGPNWECPHCRKVCNTGACRKDPRQHPYEPKGTLLGHDTKKVADVRSVECLVDFGVSNLNWLREPANAPLENSRLAKRREEAERAKQADPTLDDHYAHEDEDMGFSLENEHEDSRVQIRYSPVDDSMVPIDPALGGDPSEPWRYANGASAGPALQGGQQNGEPHPSRPDVTRDGHGVGLQHSLVAPTAVMYQDLDAIDDEDPYYYPDPNGPMREAEEVQPSRKRPRTSDEQIKLVGPKPSTKKRKVAEDGTPTAPQPKSVATKQFQVEQEKKRLEEAKKAGRYVQVYGALRGKSKVVKLSLPTTRLAEFKARDIAEQRRKSTSRVNVAHENATRPPAVLLKSDVAAPKTTAPKQSAKPKIVANQYRYRLEEDDDFDVRSRRKPKSKRQYEEITVASDEDELMDDGGVNYDAANGSSHRRRSSWLARKNRDEPELPSELPSNWKDSRAGRPRSERERNNRRTTLPAKPQAQKAPRIRPARASTGNMPEDDEDADAPGEIDEESTRNEPSRVQGTSNALSAVALAKSAAAMLEEDNRKAKLMAARWAGTDGAADNVEEALAAASPSDDDGADYASKPVQSAKPTRPPKPAAGSSILSRASASGKKIKIVSAATAAAKRAALRRADVEARGDEESDSEHEIPARKPVVGKATRRMAVMG